MSREESLNTARRLVQEAVDVAGKAGIDPSSVLAPHCTDAASENTGEGEGEGDSMTLKWCNVPVIIDNSTEGLFEMSGLNEELDQKPSFLVTQDTADLVRQDFERYKPSLERMTEDWQEEKSQFMRDVKNSKKEIKKSAKRFGTPRSK